MRTPVERAFELALHFHKGQVDKQGKPYIGHLMRVAARVAHDPILMTIALLHDILEDTSCSEELLLRHEEIPFEVIDTVKILTHNPAIDYTTYVNTISRYPMATSIKIADLRDNLDIERLGGTSANQRLKYQTALEFLLNQQKRRGLLPADSVQDTI